MLLRFAVANHLSIAEKQEFSFVATKLKGPERGLLDVPGTKFQGLASVILYGANASGKSNFLQAVTFMRTAILFSHARGAPKGGVPRIPFALDPTLANEPTLLEADFLIAEIRYQYGFTCDDDQFLSEWLYSFPEGKPRKLFERDGSNIVFGTHFKGPKKILATLMRPNSLFLSVVAQHDLEYFRDVIGFFESFEYMGTISFAKGMIENTFKKRDIDPRSIKFLQAIGTGIVNYRQSEVDIPDTLKKFRKEMIDIVNKHVGELGVIEEDRREKDVSIEISHECADGSECFFGLDRESSGTRRLLVMLGAIFRALDNGSLALVDELDASLHTYAADQIMRLFSDPEINKMGAQLIATTHDTNLLNSNVLRRDQIWFCEKDKAGATHIFPLSDIKSRPTDNFEQGYLEGRYGAIPFSGNWRALMEKDS
jgi:AAA15 family ATPase/GTPase